MWLLYGAWHFLINGTPIVPRGDHKEKAGGETEAREALPGLHQIEPKILSGIYPTSVLSLWRNRGVGESGAEIQLRE